MKLSLHRSCRHANGTRPLASSRVVGLLVLTGVWAMTASNVLAQFRFDIREVAESAFQNDPELQIVAAANVERLQRGVRVVLMKPEQFERFLFRNQAEDEVIADLNEKLDGKVKWFQEVAEFNAEKLEKVRLAGQGDIAALLFRFEQLRAEFKDNMRDQGDLMRMVQKAQPLQREMQRGQIFGPTSIFGRVANQLMESEEKVHHAEHENRKLHLFYAGAVENAIAKLERARPLQGNQRNEIRQLLMVDEALPRIQNFSTRNGGGKYMVTYAMYQLAKRRLDLDGILSKTQMRAVEPLLTAALQRKNTLRREGYLK